MVPSGSTWNPGISSTAWHAQVGADDVGDDLALVRVLLGEALQRVEAGDADLGQR